ncbi:hypothetical protein HBO32_30930 [Pseudomonas nitroreducens]|uniref:hypothetical protein n=1 Tax=Pseudomonas nitroreducens TaxID=46680 RepID=UPI0014743007|nr:hypothetical protein [Pseudomonas nitroreducens]NMZ77514.1 hypothetical protein [Pseudomonas nitroreducens]
MRRAIIAAVTICLAGCAAQKPGPRPVLTTQPPICRSDAECSVKWDQAADALQRLIMMRIAIHDETYMRTYAMTSVPFMAGEAMKISNGDGTFTIKARFTCRHDCDGLDVAAENAFNSSLAFGR